MSRIRADHLLRKIVNAPAATSPWQWQFQRDAIRLIEKECLIEPAVCSRLVDLDQAAAGFLTAEGEVLYAPKLVPGTGILTVLACGVATLGPRLEQRVTALFAARQRSLAIALDQTGNRLLFELSRALQDRMLVAARRRRLSMAGELRPGDPGLSLMAQGPLLRLARAKSIGVNLTRGHALYPLKSISMVLGAGIDLPPVRWSRCDDCRSRSVCTLVERPAEVAATDHAEQP